MRPGYYILTHTPSGLFYIGSSYDVDRRIKRHRRELEQNNHVNRRLQDVFTKWSDFSIKITETDTVEEANKGEQKLIDRHHGSKLCCNVSTSSTNGLQGVVGIVSTETRIKNLEKAAEARRGSTLSESHKANISAAHKGKRLTDEHRSKLSAVKMGSSHSEEARAKISQGNRGKTRTDEHKQAISRNKSKQLSVNGVIYESLKKAAAELGISEVTIRKRINDNGNYPNWFYL